MQTRSSQINSEFFLGLLLEENKHINPIDFVYKEDKAGSYCCVCVSFGLAQNYEAVRNSFSNHDEFSSTFFNIYASALENYRSIVGKDLRPTLLDEAKIFYPLNLVTVTTDKLVSDETHRQSAMDFLETAKKDHSYLVILRDEIAFIAIHYQDDNFIVIDPHVECCGVLSKTGVYRYVVYDRVWDFEVHVMAPTLALAEKPNTEAVAAEPVQPDPPANTTANEQIIG